MSCMMSRNIEIKARVDDLASIRDCVRSATGEGSVVLRQVDTFFACPHGHLKLRELADSRGAELIYYERPNHTGPKESRYVVHRTEDGESLRHVLSQSLGVLGVVRKRRELFLVGQTRVHLDEVEGLGSFVELEVVLRPDQSPSEGTAVATSLMKQLHIPDDHLVDRAYVELFEDAARPEIG
jgi:predicted adenylyl cyclase CyaB